MQIFICLVSHCWPSFGCSDAGESKLLDGSLTSAMSRLPADATTKAIVNTSKLTPMPHSTRSTRESNNCFRRRSLISVQQPGNLRSECYRTKWKSFFIKACSQNRLERIRLLQQSICEITQTLSFVLFSPLFWRALLVSQRKHYRES